MSGSLGFSKCDLRANLRKSVRNFGFSPAGSSQPEEIAQWCAANALHVSAATPCLGKELQTNRKNLPHLPETV